MHAPGVRPLVARAPARDTARAMSQEEVELVTRAFQAAMTRPKPDFATMNEVFHPDHILVPAAGLEAVEYQGGRGYQQYLRERSDYREQSDAPLSSRGDFGGAIDVGHHKVIAVAQGHFRGTASGAEVEQRIWAVMTIRDGQVFRTELYSDPTDALKAALSEQDAHADS
jgi:ketosteroid isomerase-like protein